MPEEAMANFGTVWRSFLALFKLTLNLLEVLARLLTTCLTLAWGES